MRSATRHVFFTFEIKEKSIVVQLYVQSVFDMLDAILVAIISSFGLGLSFFFGIVLLKNRKLPNRILGLLLIVFALRITKSILYNFVELPLLIKNLGLAANLAVGPLLYLYGYHLLSQNQSFKRSHLLHFTPSLFYVLFGQMIPNSDGSVFWDISYIFILFQSYLYLGMSIYLYRNKMKGILKELRLWYVRLIFTLGLIWMCYTLIFVGILPVYSAGPVAYSFFIVLLAYLGINSKKAFDLSLTPKYRTSKLTPEKGKVYFDKIENVMKEKQLYLNPGLTVASVAETIGISSRDVSEIINKYANQNFASYINNYRIEEAKCLLKARSKKTKIISVALDAGFNSLSTFNVAFKAITNLTPSEYRATHN
ncbi:AraC family transcriptional regulator [Flagellimonas sp. 389]|uniref:helix-turn-helix domain-containing protein n=1 Tax=Flagellimonas sp. 389 TaxID=2835862 RepID=UPI001BD45993|nr:helix-turn-helix domain-containing protein [Flagellimonas sp. 389]MBS9463508.1 AraC family transcriptional regulator [Flagellimonas sp. 389]